MRNITIPLLVFAASFPFLAGCDGGDLVVSTPPPVTNPTATPTVGLAALIAPTQTANTNQALAKSTSPTIAITGAQTAFPLLQTAIDGSFAGDAETTAKGATLTHDTTNGLYSLTVNNSALKVSNVPNTPTTRTIDGIQAFGTAIPEHRGLALGVSALDYSLFGSWLIAKDPDVSPTLDFTNAGVFAGGYVTPTGAVPLAGSASYAGKVLGWASEQQDYYEVFSGDVRFTADFATRSLSGVTSNGGLGSDNIIPPKLNDIAFSATYDPARNIFEGTVRALPGGNAFTADASGTISGHFFGPVANELGGVWTLSDTARRIIGSFGAKRE